MSDVGGKIDPPAVCLDDLANDRESKTGAALLAGLLAVAPPETLKHPDMVLRRNTGAVIRDGNEVPVVEAVGRHRDVGAVGGKAHGVGDQVGDGAPNRRSVPAHREDLGGELLGEHQACGVGRRANSSAR